MLHAKVLAAVVAGMGLTLQLTVVAQERPAAAAAPPMELTALDYIQIQQLVSLYAQYIDTCSNNGYDYADLFAPDGYFAPFINGTVGNKFQGRERLAEASRLDRLPQPDALGVVGDVLDLVRARPHVDVAQPRQRFEERVARDVEAKEACRDAGLQLGRQGRDQPGLVERRVAHRLGAERIEARGKMAVHPVRLDERHRGSDPAEEAGVLGLGASRRHGRRRSRSTVPRTAVVRRLHGRGPGLEDPSPFGRDAGGSVEVVLEKLRDVRGVRSDDVGRCHLRRVVAARSAAPRPSELSRAGSEERAVGDDRDDHADDPRDGAEERRLQRE